MISGADEPRRELFLRDDLEPADVVGAHREALHVLRDSIDTAYVDAYSDSAWPLDVMPAHAYALSLGTSQLSSEGRSVKGDAGMGVTIAVRDDAQFDVLLALAPFTIGAEAWRLDQVVFSAADTGTSLYVAVTAEQEAQLMSRLGALGIAPTAFAPRPRKQRGPFARWSRRRGA